MNKFKIIILCLFVFTVNTFLFATNQNRIDSLKTTLKNSNDSVKVIIYNQLAKEHIFNSPIKSQSYAEFALLLAKETNSIQGQAIALNNLGESNYFQNKYKKSLNYYFKSLFLFKELNDIKKVSELSINIGYAYSELAEYDKALKYLENALTIQQEINSKEDIALIYNNIGLVYDYKSEYKEAMEYFLKALKIEEELGNKEGISNVSNNMANIYSVWRNYEKALFYYLKSLKIEEELENKGGIAIAFNNIGIVYHDWKNYDKALEYYEKGLDIEKKIKNKSGIAKSLNNIAIIFDEKGEHKKALEYYTQSLKLEEELNNKIGVSIALSNIGEHYEERGNYNKALEYYQKSLDIDKEINNSVGFGQTYNQLGNLYVQLKNYNKALKYYNNSQNIVKPLNIIETITENYKGLANTYSLLGNHKKAFHYSNLYHNLKDSIFNKSMHKQLTIIQSGFEIEKRENEIEILNKNKQLQELEIKENQNKLENQRILMLILIASIIVVIVFAIIFFKQLYQKNKANKMLNLQNIEIRKNRLKLIKSKEKAEESDRLKSAFLANMSHEIRTPMNGILGFVELLNEDDIDNEQKSSYINLIKENGRQLLNIINDIIDISKIEAGQLSINSTDCDINKVLSEIYQFFNENKDIYDDNEIVFRFNQENKIDNLFISVDELRLKQVFINLIGNAFKYTNKGYIEFGYSFPNKKIIQFYVKDTGIGIPEDKFEFIFDRFRQVDDSFTRKYGGTGLGLTISRKLINLMDGRMWIESVAGKGSTFFFSLPYILVSKSLEIPDEQNNLIINNNWKGKTILIAEDVDSNYQYIEACLIKTKIDILRAKNGKEAVSICKENIDINIILMDIQMPVLNGIDAAIEIKKFLNKIPIIALTAYAVQDKLKEISKGPFEDSLTKPINTNDLLSALNNHIL
jgi:signal transduction histidine kinase/CheY-like chemotaxis protein/Tfp pilus assembly protein PilF